MNKFIDYIRTHIDPREDLTIIEEYERIVTVVRNDDVNIDGKPSDPEEFEGVDLFDNPPKGFSGMVIRIENPATGAFIVTAKNYLSDKMKGLEICHTRMKSTYHTDLIDPILNDMLEERYTYDMNLFI